MQSRSRRKHDPARQLRYVDPVRAPAGHRGPAGPRPARLRSKPLGLTGVQHAGVRTRAPKRNPRRCPPLGAFCESCALQKPNDDPTSPMVLDSPPLRRNNLKFLQACDDKRWNVARLGKILQGQMQHPAPTIGKVISPLDRPVHRRVFTIRAPYEAYIPQQSAGDAEDLGPAAALCAAAPSDLEDSGPEASRKARLTPAKRDRTCWSGATQAPPLSVWCGQEVHIAGRRTRAKSRSCSFF